MESQNRAKALEQMLATATAKMEQMQMAAKAASEQPHRVPVQPKASPALVSAVPTPKKSSVFSRILIVLLIVAIVAVLAVIGYMVFTVMNN